jgi:tetratricopeptide (TPR) repeat protein
MDKRRTELQAKLSKVGGSDINDILELMTIYARLNLHEELVRLSDVIMANDRAPGDCYFQVGMMLASIRQTDKALAAFRRYVVLAPKDPRGYVEVGWLCLMTPGKTNEGYDYWRRAVDLGGEATRSQLRSEQRFQPLWQDRNLPAPFRELVQPTRPRVGGNFGF